MKTHVDGVQNSVHGVSFMQGVLILAHNRRHQSSGGMVAEPRQEHRTATYMAALAVARGV